MAEPSLRNSGLAATSNGMSVPARRTYGHRALRYEQRVAADVAAERAGHLLDMAQVGRPVLAGRGPDGREDHLHAVQAGGQVGGEVQPSGVEIPPHELLQPRFVYRNPACVQRLDLGPVGVHARDVESHLREAGARYQPDIARADDCDLHHGCRRFVRRCRSWRRLRPRPAGGKARRWLSSSPASSPRAGTPAPTSCAR